MKTRSVGEVLAAERTQRRVSLADLSAKTRIKQSLLMALEANQFEMLPAAVFVKGYIRAYARILGFEYRPVVALLRRDFKESARGQLIPREFVRPALRRGQWLTPLRFLGFTAAVSTLVVLGYVFWQWSLVSRPPQLVVLQPSESAVVAARVTVKGQTQPDNMVLVNDQPAALRQDGSFSVELVMPTEGLATITISATDRRGKQTVKERTVMVKN